MRRTHPTPATGMLAASDTSAATPSLWNGLVRRAGVRSHEASAASGLTSSSLVFAVEQVDRLWSMSERLVPPNPDEDEPVDTASPDALDERVAERVQRLADDARVSTF